MKSILVTGAAGQLGTELIEQLTKVYDKDSIICADQYIPAQYPEIHEFIQLDVLDKEGLQQTLDHYNITEIYHLAAILSATAESIPEKAWRVNMEGLFNVLEAAREGKLDRVFWPSSIAVFGKKSPKFATPQHTITDPSTVYGISKLAGERWCEFYHEKYGVDVRSLRYPGLIGYKTLPGGGTTDYAVDIYHKAVAELPFECFLSADTKLPMMFMPDAVRATIELMQAPPENAPIHSSYNLAAISITPAEVADSIRKLYPSFSISYKPDYRDSIAQSWPHSIDDSTARRDWGWQHEYDLDKMTDVMLTELQKSAFVKE